MATDVFANVLVGDRFCEKQTLYFLTVTELTNIGFKYDITPHHIYPARYGPSLVKSGELFWKEFPEQNWGNLYSKVEIGNEQWDWIEGTWSRQGEAWI